MPDEKPRMDISKSFVPVITAIAMIVAVSGGAVCYGRLTERVAQLCTRVDKLEVFTKDTPSRREFDDLKTQIDAVNNNVLKIIGKLKIQ